MQSHPRWVGSRCAAKSPCPAVQRLRPGVAVWKPLRSAAGLYHAAAGFPIDLEQ